MIDSYTTTSSHRYWNSVLLAILIFGLVAVAYAWIWGFSALSGSLYLSLPNEKGNSALYRYQLNDSYLHQIFSLKTTKGMITEALVEQNTSSLAFTVSDRARTKSYIQIRDVNTGKVSELPVGQALKKGLSRSFDSILFAYASPNQSSNNLLFPQSWSVFVSDLSGNKRFVTEGVSPVFLPDSRIIVIKDDGLYLFESGRGSKGAKIWNMEGGRANSAMTLAISRDGKLLAWSNPLESKVFVFRIKGSDGVQLALSKTITARAYDMVFSPDGEYLALHEQAAGDKLQGVVAGYNLLSLNRKVLINMPGSPLQVSFNDWAVR